MSPKPDVSAERKQQIFEAAVACFGRKGYHLTTMDDIAAECGLSKGSLYWYFDSKKELFLYLFSVMLDQTTGTWEQIASDESLTATQEANYLHLTPSFTFIQGRYYNIRITGTNEIYRGKVYCTNQTNLEKFSVNSGEFTYYEDTDNDNQYIYR